ncbi:unnamed protein product [Symbiodinium sp. CCMP2592]|nr:unnamed protein product [Symbiodinium sp. CCMP2592]
MDPESGSAPQVSYTPSQDGSQSLGVMQQMIQALLTRLKTLIDAFGPKDQSVGVENRFYFDEAEKVWKLRGGETEEERAEAEAFRFHTGRGLSNNLAPATTACDATRGDWQSGLPPPPPATGPVSSSMHGGVELPSHAMPSLAHPVYAPQGLGQASAHVPPVPANSRQEASSAQPLANPFGQISKQPLSTPFGVGQPAVQRPVLASPFAPAL